MLGGLVIIILALRMRDSGSARMSAAASKLRTRRRFLIVLVVAAALLIVAVVVGLLAGSLWLQLGDIALWWKSAAPDLISRALGERTARVAAALFAG